jgi:hypothetical protein
MCGSSVAVHPHLHMNHISSISMDLVGTIGRSPNSQAMQGGSEVIRHLNSRLPCICTFKQHLHCLIRWCFKMRLRWMIMFPDPVKTKNMTHLPHLNRSTTSLGRGEPRLFSSNGRQGYYLHFPSVGECEPYYWR